MGTRALDLLIAGLDALAAEDPAGLDAATLREQLTGLVTAVNRVQAELSRRVDSFDQHGMAADDGCRTSKTWLQAFGRLSGPTAAGVVRHSRLLRRLPQLAAAAQRGDVSVDHLRQVSRLAHDIDVDAVAHADQILAEAAASVDPGDFAAVCERIRAHLDPDGPDPADGLGRRQLTLTPHGGMMLIRGQLDADAGAALQTALDAIMTPPVDGDERTPTQRRADALAELARRHLIAGTLPTVGGVRPQIGVLLHPQTLSPKALAALTHRRAGSATAVGDHHAGRPPTRPPATGDPPWLTWHGPISPALAQRIACDADIWRVILDPATGLPLDVGRRHRLVPHWIRRALHARDRTCRFPGCHTPAQWTDAHHLDAWAEGGCTEVSRLVLLCRFHHTLVHEYGWTIELDAATGSVTAYRPDGRRYEIRDSRPWTGPSTHDWHRLDTVAA